MSTLPPSPPSNGGDGGDPHAVAVARQAVAALGRGYDVTADLWLSKCKEDPLIADLLCPAADESSSSNDSSSKPLTQDLVIPGDVVLRSVPAIIKCDKGDRTRFASDILSFSEMAEQFNQSLSIAGKIPLGLFNSMFGFSASWQKDASSTKCLALNGVFINLYTVGLPRTHLNLKAEVRNAVPSSWDPDSLASFVEKYGTHVIIGVKIGGKDVLYAKQQSSSSLSPVHVQKVLEMKAHERFLAAESYDSREKLIKGKARSVYTLESNGTLQSRDPFSLLEYSSANEVTLENGVTIMYKRKGGLESCPNHHDWLHTVPLAPNVISMSFVPITTLLSGVPGTGFLSHAINLYLRYKPPLQELRNFLEFQLPKEWAPAFGDFPLGPPRKQQEISSLQFRLLGPKLHINTTPVLIGKRPVTGLRLCLEGKKSNRLAIHLQYLSAMPQILQPLWVEEEGEEKWVEPEEGFTKYFEPVMWRNFSHVCTAPVDISESWVGGPGGAHVVVGARFQVRQHSAKKVLFLHLLYSRIAKARIRRPEWDHMPASNQKSGIFSTLFSTTFSAAAMANPPEALSKPVVINSAVYPDGPPAPSQVPKLLKFVDTTEMTRGPHELPGHWLVTGAKLFLERGKISLSVKYSLLLHSVE